MARFLLCAFALVLLYPTAIDLYLVGLPQIAADLNASESTLHMAFSIYLAGMATTMLFAGRLSDAIGRKPIVIFGATVFVFASVLGGAAESTNAFLIARFLQGVGAGSCYVVAFAILRDALNEKRLAKVLSMLNGITCIVPVIAPVVGYAIMIYFPWQSLFTTMAGMGVLVFVLSTFVLKESNQNRRGAERHSDVSEANANLTINEPLTAPLFLSRLVITSIGVTVILTFVNVSPMLIMGELGLDRGGYSLTMAATALVSMVVSFSAPVALSYFKPRTMMLASQAVFAIAATLLTLAYTGAANSMFYFIGFGGVCAGFAVGFGATMSQALSGFTRRAGLASSVLGISQVVCSATFIWLMGKFHFDAATMLIVILMVSAVIGFALILCVTPKETQNNNEEIPVSS